MTINITKKSSSSEEIHDLYNYETSEIYSTYDLGVSSALLCVGYELLSVERDNPKKSLFIFRKSTGIEGIANNYFADKLELRARSFFDAIKALKNKLYSE
jgi:hypothetical protein